MVLEITKNGYDDRIRKDSHLNRQRLAPRL